MATYLVDTENTGHEWFDIAMRCADGHRCLLFFTDYTAKLTFSEFARLAPIAASIECIQCRTGSDALDFQLVTELGYRIAKNANEEYVIVSNDMGFDIVVKYWCDRGISVNRELTKHGEIVRTKQKAMAEATTKGWSPATDHPERELNFAKRFREAGISETMAHEIAAMAIIVLREPKKQRMTSIYSKIIKKYGQRSGLKTYRQIKPILAEIMQK